MTFITRPRVPSPTGIVIGPPVSMAFMPRTMPSVGSIETVRTRPSPRCCCTSAITSIGVGRRTFGDDSQRLIDRRQIALLKLDVNYRTDDLHDAADVVAVGARICVGRSHTVFELLFRAYEGEKLEGLKARQDNIGAKVAPNVHDSELIW